MPKDINVVETSNANKVFDIPVHLEPGQVNTLSFSQDSIAEMRELPQGELEIAFRDGSKVVIENFDELVNSAQSCGRDTIIQLSDNTIIYPEELAAQLDKGPVNFASTDNNSVIDLNAPKAGQVTEKNIESGHEYKLNFAFADTLSAAQAGQNLVLTFKDGGVLILKNYYTAMGSELPPAMTLADGSVIDSNALLTSCKLVEVPSIADTLAATDPASGTEEKTQEVASAARKGAGDAPPNVEPAAGGDASKAANAAQSVANIEPAAGDAGNQPGSSSRGYGFGSSIDGAALNGANPIGPIGATQLAYGANFLQGQLNPGVVQDIDTIPTVVGAKNTVDETNLGPNVVTGNAGADFQADGPGVVTLNTTFVASGSLAGGALTSNGDPVVVSLVGNTYTGTANGVVVFTLAIDPATGNYTFTQDGPLDHANASDPNDLITLQFGVTATDSDGDIGIGTIDIGVYDDGPVALDDGASVGSGPFTVTGNVTANDTPGADIQANVTQVVFNGVTYTVPAAGTVSIVATYGTLEIDHTGAYTYTSSNTAEGTDQFTYTLVDFDGDSASAVLSVAVTDIDTTPTISPSVGQVDETDLSPTSIGGSVTADFKDDGPGTFSLTTVTPGGSLAGGALTSHGVAITTTLVGNTYTGTAGGVTIFTLTLDPVTGAYAYTQYGPLDHADGTNPNDVITLQFGVTATDTDGDTAPTTITISVLDDAPVAANDTGAVAPGTTSVDGNVLTNDDANNDGGAHVTQVTFAGTIYTVPAAGTISITGAYGTLVIGADGAYTYTTLNTAEGTDVFTYTMQDYDHDPATATLTLTVEDIDSTPVVTPSVGQVDESNLSPTTSVVGSVGANFGDDAPGTFSLTTATPGGSLLGGALTSNGVPVVVTLSGNTYTGTAGGVTVFTLVLDPSTGAYTFTQDKALDHANGSNPNDVITLQFGVNATDSDGDTTPTTITISVLDDAPVAANDSNTVNPGTLSVDGNVVTNDNVGQDKPGYTVTQVTFGGTTVTVPASGTVTINGAYGKLVIDHTGAYTYTSFNTAEGIDQFTYQIKDHDGDTATAKLTINVPDIDTCPVVGDPTSTVDETNLGPNVVSGKVPANFYDDTPGKITFNTGFSFGGSVANNELSSCGDKVTVSLGKDGVYYGIDADGVTVFTLSLNTDTGAYTFTQFKGLDHADTGNPDDALTLKFGVTGTDSDGDTDTGTITIVVRDDGVTANDDHNLFDTNVGHTDGNVISGLHGGPGAADDLSNDGHNHVTKVTYKGVDYPVPESGEATINGDYGTLVIKADGSYTYTLYSSGGLPGSGTDDNFSETLTFPTTGEGSPTFNENSPNEGIKDGALDITTAATGQVTILSETAGYANTLGCYTIGADGTIQAVQFIAANVNELALGGTSNFNIPASGEGVGFFLVADGFNLNGGYAGMDVSTGNLAFYYHYGQDDQRLAKVTDAAGDITLVDIGGLTPVVIDGPVYHTTDRDGSNGINPDGDVHTISGLADGDPSVLRIGFEDLPNQGDQDFSDVVFDFTYTPSVPTGTHDEFTYTLVDCDGDNDTAILTFDGKDLIDDQPVITVTYATVDETIVNASGPQTVNGTITANFGADGPGTIVAAGASSFTATGNAGTGLTSNGVPVVVTLVGNQYVGKAGSLTVFSLTLNGDGTYTFVQNGQLDHADKTNPDDVINLSFGVIATDVDGDHANANIIIHVKDDGPVAVNDSNSVASAPGTVTGNVTSNDSVGEDKPGYTVKQITFGGTTVDVPTSGTISITGAHGTLQIDHNGAYTYTATSAGADVFTYKIVDQDGDPATATLTLDVKDIDTCPTVENSFNKVDETALDNSGTQTVNGTVVVDYKADGPGTVSASGSSSWSNSSPSKVLTSHGSEVKITLVGDTYTGTSADGRTIFTMQVRADGTYTFKEFDQLDHANPSNPDDVITLNFGVVATDTDGDTATANITIAVHDDGPVAVDDTNSVPSAPGSVTGNILTNDDAGADEPGVLKSVTFGSTTVAVPASGNVVIVGAHGTLTINSTGAYTYQATSTGVDQFTYKIADYDGDTATAKLTIDVKDVDTCPTVQNSKVWFDETTLPGTNSVSGNTFPDFKADGPGTVKPTGAGTFHADLSVKGGVLSSDGVPVVVTVVGNQYVGKAGSATIFTLTINDNGTYTYTQTGNLDHADGSNPDDIIRLRFDVTATDSDGDKATATVEVCVKDDAPIAVNDVNTVPNAPGQVTGNVLTNDHPGADAPAPVKAVTFGTTTVTVPATGTVNITGAHGILTIAADGSYTYKGTSEGTDVFSYKIVDFDGDPSSANLSITVLDVDTCPTIESVCKWVDETALDDSGTQTVNGTLVVDYKADGPGTTTPTGAGSFTATGSLSGGLKSHGSAVTVTLAGDTYTGKSADGRTIFTLQVKTDGTYTFKLIDQIDHADKTNPDDVINLNFGVTATDADGDHASATIMIGVKDDGPVAVNDTNTVTNAPADVTGNLLANDDAGADEPGIVKKVTFGTTTVDVPLSGTVVVTGAHGTLTVASNGTYTYHGTSVGTDTFTYQMADYDGDTATAKLAVTVNDIDNQPCIGDVVKTVDETNLGPNVVSGTVPADFYGDGPGTFTLTGFTATGSIKGGQLASCGDKITVSLKDGAYVGIDADGVTVFTLTLNSTTGAYTFTQFKGLDHADTSNPNDVITLKFTVTGKDADGDTDTGTITINVKDDGPVAHDDVNNFLSKDGHDSGNVISGLNGGAGAADVLSKDGNNHVTSVSFKGIVYDVPASGVKSVNGDYGTLNIKADGSYTYDLYKGQGGSGTTDFHETLKFPVVGEGTPTFDANSPNEGVLSTALDITTSATGKVTILSETAGYSNTLGLYTIGADGTIQAVQVVAANVNDLALGGTTNFAIPANGTGVGFFLIANGYTVNNGYAGHDLQTGDLAFYYHYGQADQRLAKVTDTASSITLVALDGDSPYVISGPVYHTTDRDGSNAINPDGLVHTISGLATDHDPTVLRIGFEDLPAQGDRDFSDVVFDFTYTPTPAQCTSDTFCYTVTDCDGDSSTAALQLNGAADPVALGTNVKVTTDVHTDVYVHTDVALVSTTTVTTTSTTVAGGVQMHLNDDGGFTVYYDAETGQVVCGTPPANYDPIPPHSPPIPEPDQMPVDPSTYPMDPAAEMQLTYGSHDVMTMLHSVNVATISDFDPGEGDMLDFSALVQGFDPLTDAINDFVYARSEGKDTVLSVDPTGQGAASQAIDVVVLKDVSINHVEDVVSLAHQQQNQAGTGTI